MINREFEPAISMALASENNNKSNRNTISTYNHQVNNTPNYISVSDKRNTCNCAHIEINTSKINFRPETMVTNSSPTHFTSVCELNDKDLEC